MIRPTNAPQREADRDESSPGELASENCEQATMAEPGPTFPYQLTSSQVLVRCGLRFILLSALATYGDGFGATLATLLALSAVFCAMAGAMRREVIFGPVLTHWDEAAGYAAVGYLATVLL